MGVAQRHPVAGDLRELRLHRLDAGGEVHQAGVVRLAAVQQPVHLLLKLAHLLAAGAQAAAAMLCSAPAMLCSMAMWQRVLPV